MFKRTRFNKICVHQTDSTPGIMFNTQTSTVNLSHSVIRCIPVGSAKAYVEPFLALPNSMYCHSVYL